MTLQTKSKRRSGVFFFITSWLVARLWWGLETSRLLILRIKPQAMVSQFARTQLPRNIWVYERNRFSCLSFNSEDKRLLITQTPTIEPN